MYSPIKLLFFRLLKLGGRFAASIDLRLNKYINLESDQAKIEYSHNITITGLLCILCGIVSIMLVCAVGQWEEQSPRRMKKKS